MFYAYSTKSQRVVNIKEAYDLKEEFRCPNTNCTALFTIHSATGKRAKHFSRKPSTPHIFGCPYEHGDALYAQPERVVKYPLDAILHGVSDNIRVTSVKTIQKRNQHGNEEPSGKIYVRTPYALYKFCFNNELSTEYCDGLTVDDIYLSSCNLVKNARFRGIQGVRLVLGETSPSDSIDTLYMTVKAFSKNGKRVTLHIAVHMTPKLLNEIKQYLISTYGRFEGNPIAVLGNWETKEAYWSKSSVTDQRNIILRVNT